MSVKDNNKYLIVKPILNKDGCYIAQEVIDSIPSADVEPVRHAHWIDEGAYADYTNVHAWRCSECEDHVLNYKCDLSRYCPNCGAKMDEENEDELQEDDGRC